MKQEWELPITKLPAPVMTPIEQPIPIRTLSSHDD